MSMRKCLLLTYHFPPSGAVAVHRMLGLVRHLPKYGWQPIVVAPPRVPWEPEDTSLLAQIPPATPVERVPFAQGVLGKIPRYLAPEAHWLWKANRTCDRLIREHRPEALISSSPPGEVHLLGLWLQRKFGLPLIADFRDPWVTNFTATDWKPRQYFDRWLERKVMNGATKLIANTPGNQRGWTAAYPHLVDKIVTITNGFDPERFPPAEPHPPGASLTILHAGELYHRRDARPLLDALLVPEARTLPIRVDFVGRQTAATYDFPSEIHQRGLGERVELVGQVPYADALQRMMRADVLLLIQAPDYYVGVPAKLYEYLGVGRPILALAEPESDIAWVLRESKVLHRVVAPTDVAGIARALVELTHEVQAGRAAAPDADALHQFTRERMARRLAQCLDECVTPSAAKERP